MPTDFNGSASADARLAMGGMSPGRRPPRPRDARTSRLSASCTNPEVASRLTRTRTQSRTRTRTPNPNQVASRLSAAGYVPATRLSLEQRYSVEEGGGAEGPAWSREGRVVTLEGGGKACRL